MASAALWLAVINGAIWLGGTVFMMLVLNPLWTASPPASVRSYWVDARLYDTIFNFFGPPWQAARTVTVVAALIACWPWRQHRRLLLITTASLAIGLAMTRLHVYPMNETLFTPAIDAVPADQVRALTAAWVRADRVRFAVMSVGFLAMLRAFSLPLPRPPGTPGAR